VDDDLDKSVRLAEIQAQLDIQATYFILNTSPYWKADSKEMWKKIKHIQNCGHEIAWHNDLISEMIIGGFKPSEMEERLNDLLFLFTMNDIIIRGSASHGNKLCYQYGYVNYECFKGMDYERKENDSIPERRINIPEIRMDDVMLRWEAYHVPFDKYYSEPGGKWSANGEPIIEPDKRIQILIHPQWWSI
jgi:hypothetical protein